MAGIEVVQVRILAQRIFDFYEGYMKPDGGPAFPQTIAAHVLEGAQCGMSLRDYFAIHEDSEPEPWFVEHYVDVVMEQGKGPRIGFLNGGSEKMRAAWRYFCADAMLEERGK